ncbi:MAG TPA: hypothetical protein VK304_14745 [Thermoleophilaceae bacterium]|nr:hypothetical protein [Thermoleophilaceae bacterium]
MDLADRLEAMHGAASDERPRDSAYEDLAGVCPGTEAARLDYRRAEVVTVLFCRIAATQADADAHDLLGVTPVVPGDGTLHRHRTTERVAGTVEGGHHAIPEGLHLYAAMYRERRTHR